MKKKIMIVSDSHGRNENLRKVAQVMDGSLDMVLHLGDSLCGQDELESIFHCPVEMVKGNSDSLTCRMPISRMIDIEGHKIFMTHGHQYGGMYGIDSMKEAAEDNGCSILMFGHTHVPMIEPYSKIAVVNPGSISQPRQDGHQPTYVIMHIYDNGVIDYNLMYV